MALKKNFFFFYNVFYFIFAAIFGFSISLSLSQSLAIQPAFFFISLTDGVVRPS